MPSSDGFTEGVRDLANEGAYRVLAKANKLQEQGHNVIRLEIGQPDFPTPEFIADAGAKGIRDGLTTYVAAGGVPALRAEIASHTCTTRGLPKGTFTMDNVVVGPGAKPGMWFAVQALVRKGDKVLIPDPGFPTYGNMVRAFGGECVGYDSLGKEGLDLSEVERKLDMGGVRVLIINSPSNPTGAVIPQRTLQHLATMLARKHPLVWVISDEIYGRLSYGPSQVPSIASCPSILPRLILVDGFSKTYSMTGWRLGWVVAGDVKLVERLQLLLTHSIGCTAPFTQAAGLAALTGPQDVVTTMLDEYRRRRDLVVDRLNKIPYVTCATPKGAFYAFPNVQGVITASNGRVRDASHLADLALTEGLVSLLPGTDFGDNGKGYIRISYVCSLHELDEGMRRLEKVVREVTGTPKAKI